MLGWYDTWHFVWLDKCVQALELIRFENWDNSYLCIILIYFSNNFFTDLGTCENNEEERWSEGEDNLLQSQQSSKLCTWFVVC